MDSAAPGAVLQAQVSAEPSTRSQPPASPGASSRPSYLGPPLPLLPSCCSSTALQPCQSLPGRDCNPLPCVSLGKSIIPSEP